MTFSKYLKSFIKIYKISLKLFLNMTESIHHARIFHSLSMYQTYCDLLFEFKLRK